MRVLVVTLDVEHADAEPEAPLRALAELGCDPVVVGLDLRLDEEALVKRPPAVILLDARDRPTSAYACLRRLRALAPLATTPSLIAVSVGAVPSLDFGAADDFVLFPVVPAELYARLRQLDWRLAAFAGEERLKVGDLVIDLAGYEAHVRDRRVPLTHQEFELLKFLAQHRGRAFTREQLLAKVWGLSYYGGTRTVDIHVRRLRAKLGPGVDEAIETIRNVGYKMKAG